MEFEKIVLITRKTRLEGLVERFNSLGQARFYLEHSGGDFSLYQREHDVYYAAVADLRSALQEIIKLQEIERDLLPNFLFTETNIVVTIGIDGLVANTAKYLNGQPLIAVNPDPKNIDGILLPFDVKNAVPAVKGVLKNQMTTRKISMANVHLNDGQTLLAFNDFFVGVKGHVSARYSVEINGRQERQSSSGIVVSTGVGSTGWLSSMFNMANGILTEFQPEKNKNQPVQASRFDWESDKLAFVVREPFISKTSSANLVFGYVTPESPLVVRSEIAESGIIFSDGVESDFLSFNSGAIATIAIADKKTNLVVP